MRDIVHSKQLKREKNRVRVAVLISKVFRHVTAQRAERNERQWQRCLLENEVHLQD
jgi:hypothetical protein